MFWYKKENLYLGQFLRILAGMILRSDVRLPPNIDDILREQEIERIKAELSPFRFVILAFLLGEIKQFGKKTFTPYEIGQVLSMATGLAYKERGLSDDEVDQKLQQFEERAAHYLSAVESTDAASLKDRGVFFFLCVYFANYITRDSGEQVQSEESRAKHFQAFDIAKQVYKSVEAAFKLLARNTEFLD